MIQLDGKMFQNIQPNDPMGGSPGFSKKAGALREFKQMQEVKRKQNEPRRFSFERLKLELLELELLGLQLRESGSRGPGVLGSWGPGTQGSKSPGLLGSWCHGALVSWSPGIFPIFGGSDPPPLDS